MAGSGVPLAIVPAGTGNVFAAALGIPRRTDAAIGLIETGQPSPVDLGRAAWGPAVEGEPGPEEGSKAFVVACGLGFDARVMAAATTDLKHRHGFRAYVFATLHEATRLRPATFRIEADGVVHEIRGLVVLDRQLRPDHPGLHRSAPGRSTRATACSTSWSSRAAGIPGGLAGAADLLLADDDTPRRRRHSLRLRAQHVRVTADPPEPVEVDGDPHEADWLEATVLPGAISVLRP